MLAALLLPLIAQSSAAAFDVRMPPTIEQDRLTVCLDQATANPSGAVLAANQWFLEANGAERSFPQECLGMAYTRQLRWRAAEDAFLAARNDALPDSARQRARLATMAGNSALADKRSEDALADLALAASDAKQAGDAVLGGEIEIDRARALVALGKTGEAGAALEIARRDAPQNSDAWLFSATLARRQGDLTIAQIQIATAAALDRTSSAIGLEAGVIAALSGNDDAARKSFQSVLQLAPNTPDAEVARTYLAQLDEAPAAAGKAGE